MVGWMGARLEGKKGRAILRVAERAAVPQLGSAATPLSTEKTTILPPTPKQTRNKP